MKIISILIITIFVCVFGRGFQLHANMTKIGIMILYDKGIRDTKSCYGIVRDSVCNPILEREQRDSCRRQVRDSNGWCTDYLDYLYDWRSDYSHASIEDKKDRERIMFCYRILDDTYDTECHRLRELEIQNTIKNRIEGVNISLGTPDIYGNQVGAKLKIVHVGRYLDEDGQFFRASKDWDIFNWMYHIQVNQRVKDDMDLYGADIVVGYMPGTSAMVSHGRASIVNWHKITNYPSSNMKHSMAIAIGQASFGRHTLTHEIGHKFGLQHAKDQSDMLQYGNHGFKECYNHGYRRCKEYFDFATVMAYPCEKGGKINSEGSYSFSTPNRYIYTKKGVTALGVKNDADSIRYLHENINKVQFVIPKGDPNRDGKIDINDVLAIIQAHDGMIDKDIASMDIAGPNDKGVITVGKPDGKIDLNDAYQLFYKILGIISDDQWPY